MTPLSWRVCPSARGHGAEHDSGLGQRALDPLGRSGKGVVGMLDHGCDTVGVLEGRPNEMLSTGLEHLGG